MKTRNRLGAVLAGAALVVATLGGSGAVAVAQAEPAAAWTLNITKVNPTIYVYSHQSHIPRSFWCATTGNCHLTKVAVWGKNSAYPRGKWFYHSDIH